MFKTWRHYYSIKLYVLLYRTKKIYMETEIGSIDSFLLTAE